VAGTRGVVPRGLPDDVLAVEQHAFGAAVAFVRFVRLVGFVEPVGRIVQPVWRRILRRRSELTVVGRVERQLGRPGVPIPAAGIEWLERWQPVAVSAAILERWRPAVAVSFGKLGVAGQQFAIGAVGQLRQQRSELAIVVGIARLAGKPAAILRIGRRPVAVSAAEFRQLVRRPAERRCAVRLFGWRAELPGW
jgi:hypothetical protein